MRKVVTISMPIEMHEHIVRRLTRTRYASVSEYIRELIRKDEKSLGKKVPPDSAVNDPDRESPFVVRSFNDYIHETLAANGRRT